VYPGGGPEQEEEVEAYYFQAELPNYMHRLSLLQEKTLIGWILSMDIRGADCRPLQVSKMPYITLEESPNPLHL
jgi:hypothetical protein